MPDIDLNQNPRIAELTRVMRRMSGMTDPAELLRAFSPWLATRFRRDFLLTISRRGLGPGEYKFTRAIPGRPNFDDLARARAAMNPWKEWDDLPVHQGGLVGEILNRGEPRVIHGLDLALDPILGEVMGAEAARMRSLAAIPTFDQGEALNWSIIFCADEMPYTLEEFEDGMLDINMIGTATRNLVARRQVETLNNRLTAQIEQIAHIQQALLPDKNPRIPGFGIATSYIPSDDTGGDYYDYYDGPDGRLGVLIADVSGHGAGAATVMAMLRAIIHCYEVGDGIDPAEFARYCNRKLAAANIEGNFITAFFCVIDPVTGELVWSRAGHNPPRIRRADGTVEVLDSAGTLPLGVVDDLEAESDRGVLNPGDTLVLYTDGITELRGPGNELFGEARFDRAVHECDGMPECVVDSVHRAMHAFTGSMTRQDDQTLVVVQRTGPGA
ncbi:MAG: serine/threonine-protein phosphatase [Phycisphaerales bacterium]|nr:serine/threonine-protein phosphatase [Phycisphaerales bacterium]